MKIGIFFEMQRGGSDEWCDAGPGAFYEALDQIVLADEFGWESAWAAEHHFCGSYSSSSSPAATLAWVAGQTKNIRLGFGVTLLAEKINHPWRVAEQVATLDILSNGRVEFGAGRGITKDEIIGFNDNIETSRSVQLEMLKMLPHIWAQDRFDWNGEHFKLPLRSLEPRPIQRPHPPMSLACTQPKSWQIAGERGLGAMCFSFLAGPALQDAIKAYRLATAASKPPYFVNDSVTMGTLMFCAETDEEAYRIFAPHAIWHIERSIALAASWADTESPDFLFYRELARQNMGINLDAAGDANPAEALLKQAVAAGQFCIGGPETCRRFIERSKASGIDRLLLQMQVGGLSGEQILRSMRLFQREVVEKMEVASPVRVGVAA